MEAPKECTNKELWLIIQGNHEETMREVTFIKEQTTKTNGNLKELSRKVASLENWRAYIVGAIAILSFAIPLVIHALLK